jgi:hypothetical protein
VKPVTGEGNGSEDGLNCRRSTALVEGCGKPVLSNPELSLARPNLKREPHERDYLLP